jgi:hypothetical protein
VAARRRGRVGGLTWGSQAVVKGMTLAALCWDAEPALRFHHGTASLQGIIAPVGSLGTLPSTRLKLRHSANSVSSHF